jgi:hypothetical protein
VLKEDSHRNIPLNSTTIPAATEVAEGAEAAGSNREVVAHLAVAVSKDVVISPFVLCVLLL